VPVIAGLPGMLVIMAVAALDLIAHASQHAPPGRSQHLDTNHAGAPATKSQGHIPGTCKSPAHRTGGAASAGGVP
jgi:hypothetical protein